MQTNVAKEELQSRHAS